MSGRPGAVSVVLVAVLLLLNANRVVPADSLIEVLVYRSGCEAAALEAYQDARRLLVEELGLEPRRELRELQPLNQDPALELVTARTRAAESTRGTSVGRERELELSERMGARPWLARTQHDFARMLVARGGPGHRERASELPELALSTYRELGMARS